MNNPSPLIPQGSLLEQKNKSRARVKVAFFCVVGVHVAAILAALLAQGCKREPVVVATETNAPPVMETNLPPLNTNPAPPEVVASNPPTITPPLDVPPAPSAQEYAIKKGDTFSSIATHFHVSVKAIQAANPTVNAAKLQIGQKIAIPAPTAPSTAPSGNGLAPTTLPADAGEQIYAVKPGDTLTKIAADHHTTINALRKLNKLTTDKIKVGDKLKVPVKAATAPATEPAPGAPPR
jgi:LysM repeat protein